MICGTNQHPSINFPHYASQILQRKPYKIINKKNIQTGNRYTCLCDGENEHSKYIKPTVTLTSQMKTFSNKITKFQNNELCLREY